MTKKLTPFLKPNEVLSETEVDYLKEKKVILKASLYYFMPGL